MDCRPQGDREEIGMPFFRRGFAGNILSPLPPDSRFVLLPSEVPILKIGPLN